MAPFGRGARLALALFPRRVVAVELAFGLRGLRPGRARVHPVDPPDEAGNWPDLGRALASLREELGFRRGTVDIALARPLARSKVVEVPPVRPREMRSIVLRDLRRYLVVDPGPVVADVRPLRRPDAATGAAVVGCAAAGLVDAVIAAAREARLHVNRITPASTALDAAVRALGRGRRRARLALLARGPGWSEVVVSDRHGPRQVVPLSGLDSDIPETVAARVESAVAGVAPPEIVVSADRSEAEGLCRAIVHRLDDSAARVAPEPSDPGVLAAFGAAAGPRDAVLLLPDAARDARRRGEYERAGVVAAVAVVLLMIAGALHLWGLHRELDAVRERRRAIAPLVDRTLDVRRSADAVRSTLRTIRGTEAEAIRWTRTFADLADALPDSVHLASFAADGRQLELGAIGPMTSAVVPRLESASGFREVTLVSPVRRDRSGDRARFEVAAVLDDSARADPAAEEASP